VSSVRECTLGWAQTGIVLLRLYLTSIQIITRLLLICVYGCNTNTYKCLVDCSTNIYTGVDLILTC
jgi:hypothetical protein